MYINSDGTLRLIHLDSEVLLRSREKVVLYKATFKETKTDSLSLLSTFSHGIS